MYTFAIRNNRLRHAVAAVLLALLSAAALAAVEDQPLPITITADNAELSRPANVSTYTGHVVLERGGLTLTGRKLVITGLEGGAYKAELTGSPATLKRVPQTGDERLITGHGQRIIYFTGQSQVTLRGNAVVNRDGDVIHSDVIRHDLETRKTVAGDPSSQDDRVKITLHPGAEDGADRP